MARLKKSRQKKTGKGSGKVKTKGRSQQHFRGSEYFLAPPSAEDLARTPFVIARDLAEASPCDSALDAPTPEELAAIASALHQLVPDASEPFNPWLLAARREGCDREP